MFVQLVVCSALLLSQCSTLANGSSKLCHKTHWCRNETEPCHPVIRQCQNGSCRFRRFRTNEYHRLILARWLYDSDRQQCRGKTNQIENFVYFRFRRDCRRLCPVVRQQRADQTILLHITDREPDYNNDTVYVNLDIDLSSNWTQKVADFMNMSTRVYNAQVAYFQHYRQHFTNFVDSVHQLMSRGRQQTAKK